MDNIFIQEDNELECHLRHFSEILELTGECELFTLLSISY